MAYQTFRSSTDSPVPCRSPTRASILCGASVCCNISAILKERSIDIARVLRPGGRTMTLLDSDHGTRIVS